MAEHVGGKGEGKMKVNRNAVLATTAAVAVLAGGGTAVAANDKPGDTKRGARCEQLLERIAERRGVSVAELESTIEARLLARVDKALAAGRISPERAAKLKQRISEGMLCKRAPGRGVVRKAPHGMLAAAAAFLGLDKAALRAALPGNSLAGLAAKQGKSADDLEAAMVAPAKKRLAEAVAAGKLKQDRADRALQQLERVAERLAAKTFPAKP
jgi:hypothetical protein